MMSNMEWNKLKTSGPDAERLFNEYKEHGSFYYINDNEFQALREELRGLWQNSVQQDVDKEREKYLRDLNFAIEFYGLLDKKGFTQWEASDDEIWAGFSLKLIPDIFYERWRPYDDGKHDHKARWIYCRTWRVWTKTLWWFIHLTMATDTNGQLDKEETRKRLQILEFTSIDDFLDRCGLGFRVEFCRKLMDRYSKYAQENKISGTNRRETWRFTVSQAYLRSGNIDPDLCGHDAFLDDILAMLKKD